ncbi:hypothetical protein TTHERM_00122340 (macronuclear) [Tetrahymena thermophila SB210]|uniref:Uncharacterized protein n=1 Tax=Tetrahymena thermophila (strain SB210) TaxID=312017 RepID=Q22YT6_TETTS|nr:hypothetical protein TTHERM_00122340 [Tetrahymena thermophila SB210]EAR90585.2 hypothetical protein TTHERM_00122340 [Tetrahymena thermophila SB210]|eukprot:XP_001010830.2 hypothetical protein TTHERM_00122340 [Tetrahymena thermophila SB210]
MSILSTAAQIANNQSQYRQSVFRIEASGADPSAVRSNIAKPTLINKRKKVFDSADYFYQQCIQNEKEQRRKDQEEKMAQQSREFFMQACEAMKEKYGESNFKRKLSMIQKEKKKFDSADYFMQKESNCGDEQEYQSEEQQILSEADKAMQKQADFGDKHFICCAKRKPLIPKLRKNFDSADYFMDIAKESGSSHPISQEEWEQMLERQIEKVEQEYNQFYQTLSSCSEISESGSNANHNNQSEQAQNPFQNDIAAPQNFNLNQFAQNSQGSQELVGTKQQQPKVKSMPDISMETEKIVNIQSDRMEAKYILHKKRLPLINKKHLTQFDSADYFMQQQQQQETQQLQQQNDQKLYKKSGSLDDIVNEKVEQIIQAQADICERHYILKKKDIIVKMKQNTKKNKFDSADYFMEKAAASSDHSISDD